MPLDHYVSQVHLRKFYSPALGDRMYALRKADLKSFTPTAKSVCKMHNGNTNPYLRKNRQIEEFLSTIENGYNVTLEKIYARKIDSACVRTIAGFAAYIITCSPAAMRIQSEFFRKSVEEIAVMMDAKNLVPPPPPILGGASLTDLLRRGALKVKMDGKFPQAFGITTVRDLTTSFASFKWDFLYNDRDDSPFFSSDFPVAIEETEDPRVLNRIIPLSPTLAVRIRPNLLVDRRKMNSVTFGYQAYDIGDEELLHLNRLIVRCAEEIVFYRDERCWVRPFIVENRNYRIEPRTNVLTVPRGRILVSTQRVVAKST